jgi:hypothetical protein
MGHAGGFLTGKLHFGGNSEIVFFDAYRHGNAWKHTNQPILSTFSFGRKIMLFVTMPRLQKNMLDHILCQGYKNT